MLAGRATAADVSWTLAPKLEVPRGSWQLKARNRVARSSTGDLVRARVFAAVPTGSHPVPTPSSEQPPGSAAGASNWAVMRRLLVFSLSYWPSCLKVMTFQFLLLAGNVAGLGATGLGIDYIGPPDRSQSRPRRNIGPGRFVPPAHLAGDGCGRKPGRGGAAAGLAARVAGFQLPGLARATRAGSDRGRTARPGLRQAATLELPASSTITPAARSSTASRATCKICARSWTSC